MVDSKVTLGRCRCEGQGRCCACSAAAHLSTALAVDEPIPFKLCPVSASRLGLLLEAVALVDVAVRLDEAVDWSNVTPHPDLERLEERCRCGAPRGEHLTTGDQRAERWPCNGWRPSTVDGSKAGGK